MTKLEEKLIELGYECKNRATYDKYEKVTQFDEYHRAIIEIIVENKKIKHSSFWHPSYISYQ